MMDDLRNEVITTSLVVFSRFILYLHTYTVMLYCYAVFNFLDPVMNSIIIPCVIVDFMVHVTI